jgi:hypothetical protein
VLKLLDEEIAVFCFVAYVINIYVPSMCMCELHLKTRHAAQHTTGENTTHQLKHTCASRGLNHMQQNRKQQFPRPVILTPDDDRLK